LLVVVVGGSQFHDRATEPHKSLDADTAGY
jgi:hypothetical protein